jgi:hypothetical protein
MFARAVRLFDNPIPEANEALVTNPLNLLQRQGVDHLPQRPSILLGPLPQMAQSSDIVVFYPFVYDGARAIAGASNEQRRRNLGR